MLQSPCFFASYFWTLAVPILFVIAHTGFARGSLYPTKPIGNTVFLAGQPAQLKWVEDGHTPLLRDMGLMKIDLYAGSDIYLATIAKNIKTLDMSTTVYIPLILPANYHICTLRFRSTKPPTTIWTANFTVISSPAISPISPASSALHSSTTITSMLSRSTQPALPNPSIIRPQDSATSGIGLRLGEERLIDVDKMKFRLVSIVWPALIGLSLAM